MQILLRTLIESSSSIAELAATVKLPAKPSYALGRTLDSAASEQRRFHQTREKIAKSLAEIDEAGKPIIEVKKDALGNALRDVQGNEIKNYKLSSENEENLRTQLDEILDEKVEIAGRQIALAELGNIEIRAEIFKNLGWLIVEILGTQSEPVIANSPIVGNA